MRLDWAILSGAGLPAVPQGSVPAEFVITNTGGKALSGAHWAIYFNCMEDVALGTKAGHVALDRVVGPLYRLRPTDGIADLGPGQSLHVPLVHPDSLSNVSLAPEGPYLVLDSAPDVGLPIVSYHKAAFPADHATTPEQIYDRNVSITPVAAEALPPVFPTPLQFQRRSGALAWSGRPQVTAAPELHAEAAAAEAMLQGLFAGAAVAGDANQIRLSVVRSPGFPSRKVMNCRSIRAGA